MGKMKTNFDGLNEQREFFLWRFPKLTSRNDINSLQSDFSRIDNHHVGTINEIQTLMLMESRGLFKSAFELRLITSQFGEDKTDGRSLNFMEVCCAVYGTSWEALNEFVDDEARDRALLKSKVAAKEIAIAAAKIAEAKLEEANAANERATIIEKESRLVSTHCHCENNC